MNLASRLKNLRRDLGFSQEAIGAQGFVSAPAWIKIENGQRQASEKLIERITKWLVQEKYMRAGAADELKEELFTLKYLGNRSVFIRAMAAAHAHGLPNGEMLLAPTPIAKPRRGRPPKATVSAIALVAETPSKYSTKRVRRPKSGN